MNTETRKALDYVLSTVLILALLASFLWTLDQGFYVASVFLALAMVLVKPSHIVEEAADE